MIADGPPEAFERIRGGGHSATREQDWETIYRAVWPVLVARISKRGLACFAADAVQATLLAILTEAGQLAEFATLDDFVAYCSRAASNRAVDAIRRTLRLDAIEGAPEPATSQAEDPMLLYIPTDLSSEEKALAQAFYLEGRNYGEIATSLGLSERDVKTRMFMLQKKLQEIQKKP